MRVIDVSGWVASHFKFKSNIVYRLWLWRTKTNTGDPDLNILFLNKEIYKKLNGKVKYSYR